MPIMVAMAIRMVILAVLHAGPDGRITGQHGVADRDEVIETTHPNHPTVPLAGTSQLPISDIRT
jgi:hypothetical protein